MGSFWHASWKHQENSLPFHSCLEFLECHSRSNTFPIWFGLKSNVTFAGPFDSTLEVHDSNAELTRGPWSGFSSSSAEVAGRSSMSSLMVVDFPTPEGPTKATHFASSVKAGVSEDRRCNMMQFVPSKAFCCVILQWIELHESLTSSTRLGSLV